MRKREGPGLGEMVRFTRYMGKFAREEYDKAEVECFTEIAAKFLPNPNPEEAAMVVGAVSKSVRAIAHHDDYGEIRGYSWHDGNRRQTFYVLRRSLRGRKFLVLLEDIVGDGRGTE